MNDQAPQLLAGLGFQVATLMGLEPTTSCVTDIFCLFADVREGTPRN